MDLPIRPRRLRHTAEIRDLVRENIVSVSNLVQPLFVIDGNGESEPIASMPGQKRLTISQLVEECRDLHGAGIRGVALFPKLDEKLKNMRGTEALNKKTLILRAASAVKAAVPGLLIFADIALDPYTTHGHDGVLTKEGSDVDNDQTVEILCKMAVLHAEAGVDFVAPSDMMDGRIAAIRKALDAAGYQGTGILAYSAKFSSAYYGPFRDAVGSLKVKGSALHGKDTYQLDPANGRAAMREIALDEAEGADMVMVKPAGPYLDVIREAREATNLPLAAYQVSGEYSQIVAAAKLGWLDYKRTRDESLMAIKRAGADFILTYFAGEIARQEA
jgi:porphobilinogen synthase